MLKQSLALVGRHEHSQEYCLVDLMPRWVISAQKVMNQVGGSRTEVSQGVAMVSQVKTSQVLQEWMMAQAQKMVEAQQDISGASGSLV